MGRRHRVFAIAKIRPHGSIDRQYRCVAAYQHEWCWEDLPLLALRRCLGLLKQLHNAEVVRAELRTIEGKYTRSEDEAHSANVTPRTPCPFLAFVLAISWTTELEDGLYASGSTFSDGLLHAGLARTNSEQGSSVWLVFVCFSINGTLQLAILGNDEGITVIDVTDPQSPAYCFMRQCRTILSAADYFWYPEHPCDIQVQDDASEGSHSRRPSCVSNLSGIRTITLDILAETWPLDFAEDVSEAWSLKSSQRSLDFAKQSVSRLPTLGDLSIKPALLHSIRDSRDAIDEFVDVAILTRKDSRLNPLLRGLCPFPNNAIYVLLRLIKKAQKPAISLDLSDFYLSEEQVLRIVSTCDGLQSLNLSFNPHITVSTIREVLMTAPAIRRLVIMGCPSIDTAQLHGMMRKEAYLLNRVEALIHPSLMPSPEKTFESIPVSFSVITFRGNRCKFEGCSLPLFTPGGVVQSFKSLADILLRRVWSHWSIGMVAQAAFSCMTRQPEERWNERSVIAHTTLSLDILRVAQPGWALVLESRGSAMQADATVHWTFMRVRRPFDFAARRSTPSETQAMPAVEREKVGELLDGAFEMHDLDGFLVATANEIRPPACADDVEELRAVLYGNSRARKRFPVMKKEEVQRMQTELFRLDHRKAAFSAARWKRENLALNLNGFLST